MLCKQWYDCTIHIWFGAWHTMTGCVDGHNEILGISRVNSVHVLVLRETHIWEVINARSVVALFLSSRTLIGWGFPPQLKHSGWDSSSYIVGFFLSRTFLHTMNVFCTRCLATHLFELLLCCLCVRANWRVCCNVNLKAIFTHYFWDCSKHNVIPYHCITYFRIATFCSKFTGCRNLHVNGLFLLLKTM